MLAELLLHVSLEMTVIINRMLSSRLLRFPILTITLSLPQLL